MESRISILKNTIALSIPNVLNPIISFILVLIISRYLGVEGLGQYSLVLAYFGIFATLGSLGLADLVVREVARRPADAHLVLVNAGAFGTISSLVAVIAMNAVVALMGYGREVFLAGFFCSLSLVISTAITYLEAIFRSLERSEYVALIYIAENAVRVVLCVGLLLMGFGIIPLFVAVLVSRVFGFAAMAMCYQRTFGWPAWRFDREIWRLLARQSATFASIAVFSTIHLSIDQIMLSKLKTIDSVGIFSAADRLLSICKTLPLAFSSALLPFIAKVFSSGTEPLRDLVIKSLNYMLLLVVPMAVGTFVLADQFIGLVYGQKFTAAGPVLRLHILSLIPFSMVFVMAQVLIATDNQAVDLRINNVAALINVILNFIFIPPLAEIGAVLATLLTIMVFNYLQNRYISRHLFRISLLEAGGKAFLASLAMGAVTYLLRDWNLFLNIAVSAAVYTCLAIMLKAFSPRKILEMAADFSSASGKRD